MQSSIKKQALVIIAGLATWFGNAQEVLIKHHPEHPILEKLSHTNLVNFDFIISNPTQDTLKITRLEVRLYDKNNQLVQQKFLDNNGTAPSINTIPDNQWNGVSKKMVFNPFPEIDPLVSKLEYTFTFNDAFEKKTTVVPKSYHQEMDFTLPLQAKLLVYDGHDFYSHHRRFDYEFAPIKALGFQGNFMRYAYDFVIIDADGNQFTGKGENSTDWHGFGKEVFAVAEGEIVALESNQNDDKSFDIPSLKTKPLALYGNYVVIKHDNQTYSMYGHLKKESSKGLHVGTKVKKGQKIGQIGVSGSSFFPHLHFEVRNAVTHESEGIPSYFTNFNLFAGSSKREIKKGTLATGDIIQTQQ